MQPKDFLYFITDKEGKSARINNGVPEFISVPTPLEYTPDGWQEKAIHFTRNSRYAGVFRSFTTPLKLVKDGAHILRDRVIKKGTEDKLYLIILWLDKSFAGGWIHRLLYKGEFDLTNLESEDDFVTTNILEGDLMKFIKANENTQYEIPLDVPEAIQVKSDGIELDQTSSYILTNGTLADDLGGHSLDLQILNIEALSSIGSVDQTRIKSGNSASVLWANDNWFNITKDSPVTFKISWKFRVYLTLASGISPVFGTKYFLQLLMVENSSSLTPVVLQEIGGGDPLLIYNKWNTFEGEMTVVVPANRKLVIYMSASINRDFTFFTYDNENNFFKFGYTYKHPKSFVPHLRPAYVAQQLLNKMTESTDYTFESDYLTTVWENLVLTSGNAIRGIAGSVLKTSWNEFFDSYNVPCNISMKVIGKTVKIEQWAEAYQLGVAANIGDANEFSWKIPSDLLFSGVKIGYPDINYENTNGKKEFNTVQSYVGPIKKVNRLLELTSKYRADSYGYEFIRIEGAGKDTTDLKSDNDVFLTHVEKTATVGTGTEPALFYKFLRNPYTITGLIKPTYVWNVEISPKRCLLAHGNRLRSIYYWQSGEKLTFQSAPKDTAMKTTDGSGNVIEERADVFIGNMAAAAYIPIQMKASGKINSAILNAIQAEAHGSVAFTYDGNTFFGFVNDIAIQPATLASQDTTMLCSPLSDITKLIH